MPLDAGRSSLLGSVLHEEDLLTPVDVDWDGPLVVLDLSAVHQSDALPILMTCAAAWLQAAFARPGAGKRIIVIDEAWSILKTIGIARWLQANRARDPMLQPSNHRLPSLEVCVDALPLFARGWAQPDVRAEHTQAQRFDKSTAGVFFFGAAPHRV